MPRRLQIQMVLFAVLAVLAGFTLEDHWPNYPLRSGVFLILFFLAFKSWIATKKP